MGKVQGVEMKIKLLDPTQCSYNPYRLSEDRKQKLQDIVDELLQHNVIREYESAYASPVVVENTRLYIRGSLQVRM